MTVLCEVLEVDLLDPASCEASASSAANILREHRKVIVAIRANVHSSARTGLVRRFRVAQRKSRSFDHDLRNLRRRGIDETMNRQTLEQERLGIVPVATLRLDYSITYGAEELRQLRCLHATSSPYSNVGRRIAIAGSTRFHANSDNSRAD